MHRAVVRHGVLHRREDRAAEGELTYAIDPGGTASMVFQPDGRVVHVEFIAQEALGLTDEEATALFDGDNELADVEALVELIVSGDFDEDDWLNRRDRHRQELA